MAALLIKKNYETHGQSISKAFKSLCMHARCAFCVIANCFGNNAFYIYELPMGCVSTCVRMSLRVRVCMCLYVCA